jgi:hypothetical protein
MHIRNAEYCIQRSEALFESERDRERETKTTIVIIIIIIIIIIFSDCAAQRGLWTPRSRGFFITHNDAPQSVVLLWTSDQLVAETSTFQNTTHTTDKHPCPR